MSEKGSEKVFQQWDDRSAGAWREYVKLTTLSDDKITNDGIVANLAKTPNVHVLASQHLTSASVKRGRMNVERLKTYQLVNTVEKWMDDSDIDWRLRTKRHCQKTPFKCISADEWVDQFARVDPRLGRRAGAALLAQFRVIGDGEFAEYFTNLPEADIHTFFIGADPHSGDFALINILAANINNASLLESTKLPQLKNGCKVRLYCDGSWSGGELQRRIRCMFTQCGKKANALNSSHTLDVRTGFITDVAEVLIERKLKQLVNDNVVKNGSVRVSCPDSNRLRLRGVYSDQKGLAFHKHVLLKYVDENQKALRELCNKIGKELSTNKPLGTNDIASCIAFSHSLPAAMLPLFTINGVQVTDSKGQKFAWKALLQSQHVSTGRPDEPDRHCEQCPLADR